MPKFPRTRVEVYIPNPEYGYSRPSRASSSSSQTTASQTSNLERKRTKVILRLPDVTRKVKRVRLIVKPPPVSPIKTTQTHHVVLPSTPITHRTKPALAIKPSRNALIYNRVASTHRPLCRMCTEWVKLLEDVRYSTSSWLADAKDCDQCASIASTPSSPTFSEGGPSSEGDSLHQRTPTPPPIAPVEIQHSTEPQQLLEEQPRGAGEDDISLCHPEYAPSESDPGELEYPEWDSNDEICNQTATFEFFCTWPSIPEPEPISPLTTIPLSVSATRQGVLSN